jgi:DNA-binding MarR family transcriptional regulator
VPPWISAFASTETHNKGIYSDDVAHNEILESLLVTSNRLIRIAAQATGNTTPSAVWRTLSILENLGPLRVGELAAASRISQPGITRLLPAMIDDGLVSRAIDRGDSRALVIGLTRTGRERLIAWRHELSTTLEPLFGDLEPREWQTLERAAAILASRTAVDVLA